MGAVILCEFPSDNGTARTWILAHITALAVNGEAEVKFIATEQATAGKVATETIAIAIASIERGHTLLSGWRAGGLLPAAMEMRLLRTESVALNLPMPFP